ncbi:VanZ family protein [Shewanella sp. FJAT-52076]|uniref:VanZ family protein n=1 Tax=Shewanella sp. FJAT-52076 TaxID=2864202 RepID=UPI001C6586E7|nr:VanZ family protein [Shewanella sp. FJAT-52076]QYJ77267.1 VanZ family protein [Shewanella sp. FJAT-52076]
MGAYVYQRKFRVKNRQFLFKIILVIALCITSYLVFSKPSYPQSIPHLDKVGHFGTFFGLAWLTQLAFRPRWYIMLLALAAYAGLIEVIQSRLPYRSASWGDIAADLAGVAAFFLTAWLYSKYRRASRLQGA